jgi:hypothetical protein
MNPSPRDRRDQERKINPPVAEGKTRNMRGIAALPQQEQA